MKRKPTKNFKPKWQCNRDEAYKAVEMVIQGKTASNIAVELFGNKSPASLGRVRALLKYAESEGIFTLNGQLDAKTAQELKDWCNNPEINFYVVKNDRLAYNGNPTVDEVLRADAVARKAAEVVAERIADLLVNRKKKPGRIVVANAGGFAVSRIVKFLASHRLVPDETNVRQLLFISLNSASMPTDYGRSANTLAVRMAEIYGGQHIALCPIWPDKDREIYEDAVKNIDLLLCGAGSERSILFTWLQQNAGITLPKDAVGDICLIPISKDGHEVPLDEVSRANINRLLNLHPTYTDLHALAGRNGIVFVPMGYRSDDSKSDAASGSTTEHSKIAVTRAILKHSLARTCILGTTLASALVKSG